MALAGAPLNTCKACAAVRKDIDLTCQWLLAAKQRPLLAAAKHGLWKVCSQLLKGRELKPQAPDLQFALIRAAVAGQSALVGGLLDARVCELEPGAEAAPASVQKLVAMAFEGAVKKGHLAVVRLMLDRRVALPAGTLTQALQGAAGSTSKNVYAIAELLLKEGADVNGGLPGYLSHKCPLGLAITGNTDQLVALMLKRGAHVDRAPQDSWAQPILLHAAVSRKGCGVMRDLLRRGAREGLDAAIDHAACAGKWEMVQVLLDARAGNVGQ
jgi:ankyrin repeat protein